MSDAYQFYISTLLIYLFIDIMGVLGLNLQFGVAGIINFAYIVFVAVGAYTAAVVSLGPNSPGSSQQYMFGASWPFPLPIIAGGVAAGLLSLVVGVISLRRLRSDYQAMVMLVLSLIATLIASNATASSTGRRGSSYNSRSSTSWVSRRSSTSGLTWAGPCSSRWSSSCSSAASPDPRSAGPSGRCATTTVRPRRSART